LEDDVFSQQTMVAGKYEIKGFGESPMKLMDTINGDK
jgi:hypothetical protein